MWSDMSIPRSAVDRIAPTPWRAEDNPARPLVTPATPKILLYSHDTFGLGNIRRSILLGELFTAEYPRAAVLLVTGSPMIHAFRIPDRMDYVKLPCLNRVSAEQYAPRFLVDCADEVRRTRSEIIEHTAIGFQPDIFIVDKRAAGIEGELVPALEALRRLARPPRVVLGLRDILDAPARTRQALRTNGSFEIIERYYDEVWIYGSRGIFDAVAEYDFPPGVGARTRYCGYLRRRALPRPPRTGTPRVLVTTGGGADGDALIRSYLAGLAGVPPGELTSLVILGPQLDLASAEALRALAAGRPDVTFIDFEADLTRRYAEADVVVSMAGYNTVCELLTANATAVLVPRAEPVEEQLIRARCLASRRLFSMVEPSELTPDRLMGAVRAALASTPAAVSPIDMEGLMRIRTRVDRLLDRSGA